MKQGYEIYGFNVHDNGDVVYREWAPNAMRAYLIGDFNGWNRDATPMTKNSFGVFEVTVPGKDGQPTIPHDSKIKVRQPHRRPPLDEADRITRCHS
jgi:1,4-alpha-glucan branching enzyme